MVVADQRSPRDGRFIETIGHYNPQTDPSTIVIDESRLEHWLSRGAQPTGTVKHLMKARAAGPPPAAEAPAPVEETAAPDEPEPAPEPAAEEAPAEAASPEESAG